MSKGAPALAGAAALAVSVSVGAPPPDPAGPSGRYVVEIRGFAFSPALLEVAAGDTVVWVNRDVVPHTAADTSGAWDSGRLAANASWTWIASEPGVFGYLCAYHPTMRGAVAVRPPGSVRGAGLLPGPDPRHSQTKRVQ